MRVLGGGVKNVFSHSRRLPENQTNHTDSRHSKDFVSFILQHTPDSAPESTDIF